MLLGSEPALLNLCFIFVNRRGRGPGPSTKHNPKLLLDVFPVKTNNCSSLRSPLHHLLYLSHWPPLFQKNVLTFKIESGYIFKS